ncbi:hypothetical protein [Nocardia salmonicida]|uniref:hypothetical protein n=1 Tax=Nocardia salmonicida TaxID=53431 RepID=UPI003793F13C
MISEAVRQTEDDTVIANVAGVGGPSIEALGNDAGILDDAPLRVALEKYAMRTGQFPLWELVAHYRAMGRFGISQELRSSIIDIASEGVQDPVLETWLPMTIDQTSGNYATYCGLAHIDYLVGEPNPSAVRIDEFIAAAVCDLISHEARAYAHEPRPIQLVRARGAVRLLAHVDELAPTIRVDSVAISEANRALELSSLPEGDFIYAAQNATSLALIGISDVIIQGVERTLLPASRLHDEVMFIRNIQIFECMYRQVGRAVEDALNYVGAGRGAEALEVLEQARARLLVVPALFRVLTTMPADVFAVIRGFTHGRSAVQSRTYKRVEELSAPRPGVRDVLTLQQAFLANSARLEHPDVLADSMRRLDSAWRSMKRGHWGITLKIIGNAPGTGGTAGAEYLRKAAETALFPELMEGI